MSLPPPTAPRPSALLGFLVLPSVGDANCEPYDANREPSQTSPTIAPVLATRIKRYVPIKHKDTGKYELVLIAELDELKRKGLVATERGIDVYVDPK